MPADAIAPRHQVGSTIGFTADIFILSSIMPAAIVQSTQSTAIPACSSSMQFRTGRRVPRMISRILLTVAIVTVAGFVLLVLVGPWDRYEKEAAALGFSGPYERYLATRAGFPNDPANTQSAGQALDRRETTAIEE
jgi:hypothetical protein